MFSFRSLFLAGDQKYVGKTCSQRHVRNLNKFAEHIYIHKHDEIMANSRPVLYEKLSFRPRPGRLNTFLQEERKETIT